jgi:hypothetical protein
MGCHALLGATSSRPTAMVHKAGKEMDGKMLEQLFFLNKLIS